MNKNIIKKLKDYFDKDFRSKLKHEKSLKGLIKQLEEKEDKLSKKLKEEQKESKRKLMKKQLKVLAAQIKKAKKMID